jgi:hypothetical protein
MHWIYAHLIGDYLLQTDWMAKGKRTSSWICTVHVAVYMLPFLLCSFAWWQLLLIAIQHWIQDRTQLVAWVMRWTGKSADGFMGPPFTPWSFILMDNILHVLWMAAVAAAPDLCARFCS